MNSVTLGETSKQSSRISQPTLVHLNLTSLPPFGIILGVISGVLFMVRQNCPEIWHGLSQAPCLCDPVCGMLIFSALIRHTAFSIQHSAFSQGFVVCCSHVESTLSRRPAKPLHRQFVNLCPIPKLHKRAPHKICSTVSTCAECNAHGHIHQYPLWK